MRALTFTATVICTCSSAFIAAVPNLALYDALHEPLYELLTELVQAANAVPQMTASGEIIERDAPAYRSGEHLPSRARWRAEQAARIRALAVPSPLVR